MNKQVQFIIGTLSTGGAERTVSNLSQKLPDTLKKEIIMFGKKARIDYDHAGRLIYLDRIDEDKNLLYKLIALFSRLFKLKITKKNNQDKVYISFLEYPNILNILTKGKEKTIVSVRNHMSTKHDKGLKNKLWNLSIKYLYNKADIVIAVSEEIKNDLINAYSIKSDNIEVIYNSYDIDHINQQSKEELEPRWQEIFSKPVIVTAGRLDMQKGQWHLIRVLNNLKEMYPDIQLVVLGRGKIENKIKDLVDAYDLNENVHFLGFQSNPFKFIAKSNMFVMTSLYEGFPNALAEAMACGVPVISTDCLSGPREMLAPLETSIENQNFIYGYSDDRYGILTPAFTTENFNSVDELTEEELFLKNSIENVLNDDELVRELSSKSIKRVNDFDINIAIEKWESMI